MIGMFGGKQNNFGKGAGVDTRARSPSGERRGLHCDLSLNWETASEIGMGLAVRNRRHVPAKTISYILMIRFDEQL